MTHGLRILYVLSLVLLMRSVFSSQARENYCFAADKAASLSKQPAAQEPPSAKKIITRSIAFPERPIGQLYLGLKPVAAAKGLITVKSAEDAPVYLIASANLIREPQLLDSLKPDALTGLEIRAVLFGAEDDGVGDKILAHVAHLTGLQILALNSLDVSDAGLSQLKNLKELRFLCSQTGSVNGSCFRDLSSLPFLFNLDLSDNPLKLENLHYLAQFPKLSKIRLNRCNIEEKSVAALANCRALEDLSVAFNPRVDDGCIKYLLLMKHLKKLDLAQTKVTFAGVQKLQNLEKLRYIAISDTNIPPAEQSALRTKLKHVDFHFIQKPGKVNADQGTIFAPL